MGALHAITLELINKQAALSHSYYYVHTLTLSVAALFCSLASSLYGAAAAFQVKIQVIFCAFILSSAFQIIAVPVK